MIKKKSPYTDKRMLEALDYLDLRFVAEVTDKYRFDNIPGEYKPNKRRIYKAYAVALMRAACVLLLIGLVASAPAVLRGVGLIGPGQSVGSDNTESQSDILVDSTEGTEKDPPEMIAMPTLTEEERKMILEAAKGEISEPFTCFLKFGDIYAVKQDKQYADDDRAHSIEMVMGFWEFRYVDTYDDMDPILIIKNGNTYGLEEAYLSDETDKEFVKELYFTYRGCFEYLYSMRYDTGKPKNEIPPMELIELTEEEKDMIFEAYKEYYIKIYNGKFDEELLPPTEELFAEMRENIECYGKADSPYWSGGYMYAIRFPYEIEDDHITSDYAGGYWFHYTDHQEICLFYGGEISSIMVENENTAFINEVNKRHRYLNPELYEYFEATED